MKEIDNPSTTRISESRVDKEFATKYLRNYLDSSQRFLEFKGILSEIPMFNPHHEFASNVFTGAILYASEVFKNGLLFGDGDYRIEDKHKMLAHIEAILEILRNPNK